MPIAPYPSPAELYKLRMAELQRLLQQNGTFKSELMQAFLSAAQVSFREHQRSNNNNTDNQKNKKSSPQTRSDTDSSAVSSPSVSSNMGLSPAVVDQNIQNKNHIQNIDSKSGLIEDLDNVKIGSDRSVTSTDNNSPNVSTTSVSSPTDFTTNTGIKIEPGLDNQNFTPMTPMMDNSNNHTMGGGMPPMPDAASPFMMPDLSPGMMMMMPDMMEMMGDSSMMEGMMSGMMSGGKLLCLFHPILVFIRNSECLIILWSLN